ncbi:unnamed protein product [Lymnaea stagnalis]|uniref:VWFC domain-containing protein n=1 Tax=Lymnaea stagnalis TaxID=6523 RepID=A0AAV2HR96_LYMST
MMLATVHAGVFCLLSCLTVSCLSGAVPRQAAEMWCDYGGHRARAGESFQLGPCEPCWCDYSGQVSCASILCAQPNCVDAVRDPSQCCSVCPNGPNCALPGGGILGNGQTVTLTDGSWCSCRARSYNGVTLATCTRRRRNRT